MGWSAARTRKLRDGDPVSALRDLEPEKDFQARILELALDCGWRWYHPYDSRRSIDGWPDLVLIHTRRQVTVFAELKDAEGRISPEQERWLEDLRAAGHDARLWRPSDWDEIEALLTGREAGYGPANNRATGQRAKERLAASPVPASDGSRAPAAIATGPCPPLPASGVGVAAPAPTPNRQRATVNRQPLRVAKPGDRRQPGAMTASEAGRLGGLTTAATYGPGYMRRLARKGGAAGGRPKLRTLAEIEAETHGSRRRPKGGASAS